MENRDTSVKLESLPKSVQKVIEIARYVYSVDSNEIPDTVEIRNLVFREMLQSYRCSKEALELL